MRDIIVAFAVGGAICVVGQILMDKCRLTPAHTMVTLVVIGAVLGGLGWYEPFVEFAGAGATTPIISFGNSLVKGAIAESEASGLTGLATGMFEMTSSGISAAIVFAFLASLFCKPKG